MFTFARNAGKLLCADLKTAKFGCAGKGVRFVKDTPLRFALRETKAIFLDIRVVVALIAIAAILTIAEPFGTAGRIRLVPRAAYWLLIVGVTFATGSMISAAINRALSGRPGARWKAMIAASSRVFIACSTAPTIGTP